jgi:hypothetical protein
MSASTAASPTRQSLLARAAAAVASKPTIALAVIVVLTIVVIATLVYYRGVLSIGPYYKPAVGGKQPFEKGETVAGPAAATGGAAAASSQSDAETERLIESINGAPGQP